MTYLSLRNVSGIFLGLQMDVNLVELNFIYFVSICCFWDKVLCILLLRWLVFRYGQSLNGQPLFFASVCFSESVSVSLWAIRDILLFAVSIMLGCGAVKYSTGDVSWRNLTAMVLQYNWRMLLQPCRFVLMHEMVNVYSTFTTKRNHYLIHCPSLPIACRHGCIDWRYPYYESIFTNICFWNA